MEERKPTICANHELNFIGQLGSNLDCILLSIFHPRPENKISYDQLIAKSGNA